MAVALWRCGGVAQAEWRRRQRCVEEGTDYERRRRKYGQSTGAPKLLADLVEALLGAVMIDSGGDIAEVRSFERGEGRRLACRGVQERVPCPPSSA